MKTFEKTKYRIDFSYWINGIGYTRRETTDNIDYLSEAEEYVNHIEKTARELNMPYDFGMPVTNYDGVLVEMVDNYTNRTLSRYFWANVKRGV